MKIKLSKTEWRIVIGFGIVLLFIPYIFTRELGIINFKDSGEIGDTIGGITSPFLGFFGSLLVYLALKAQIEANEQVRKQFEKQEFENIIESRINYFEKKILIIKDEINGFYFSYNETVNIGKRQKYNYEGAQAIHNLLVKVKNHHLETKKNLYLIYPKLSEFKSLLLLFNQTVEGLKTDTLLSLENKTNLLEIAEYLYYSKLSYIYTTLEKYQPIGDKPCSECGKIHGIPKEIYECFAILEASLNSVRISVHAPKE